WFSRSAEGDFDMSLIAERGMYNATANDMIQASASKIGMNKIKDAGQALVNNSYIQVVEFKNVITMQEYYDAQDAANLKYAQANNTQYKPVSRTKNGWKAIAISYLFKIDPAYVDVLFNEMWIYSDDDANTRAQKKALFDNTNFNFNFVMQVTNDADGSQDNPNPNTGIPAQLSKEQLFARLVNSGVKAALYEFETKYEDFRVKTALFAVRPLRSKIGTKEGLGVDQRFFVLENTMNSKGEILSKRQGVILVKKVENNSVVATTANIPMSKFYQTAGKRLEPGMTMQQRNDYGVGLSMGAGGGALGGFYMKAEGNLATLSRMLPGITNAIKVTQLKVFGSVAFDSGEYSAYDANFTRYQIGISKGFYFMRNLSLAPFIAYGSESATSDYFGDGYSVNGDFLNFGAYFTLNILYNLQLVTTLNAYGMLGNAYQKYDGETTATYVNTYDEYFDGRSGGNIEFGIRYEF
ncbi:MAG: autotransporter outer membrane beta-barrel domain-containing protein, partial [Paludibacter sp.]|nr:autotransporter outer membrane beta-barrel domain-containing protein [Paludibacter sp.]